MKSEDLSSSFLEPKSPFKATGTPGRSSKLHSDLEQIVSLAAVSTGCETAIVKRLHEEQFILEASFGTPNESDPSLIALNRHTIEADSLLAFEDLLQEPKWNLSKAQIPGPSARRYGGAPVKDAQDQTIGILAVFSSEPGPFTAEQRQSLLHLATLASRLFASAELEIRLSKTDAELVQTRKE